MEAVVVEKKANFYLTIAISRNARGWNFTLGKLSVVHCSPKWTIKVCLFLYFEKSPFWSDRKVSEYFVFQVYLIFSLIKYTTNIRRKYSRSTEREGNSLWLNHPCVHLHHYHPLLIWSTINIYKSSFFTSPVLPSCDFERNDWTLIWLAALFVQRFSYCNFIILYIFDDDNLWIIIAKVVEVLITEMKWSKCLHCMITNVWDALCILAMMGRGGWWKPNDRRN